MKSSAECLRSAKEAMSVLQTALHAAQRQFEFGNLPAAIGAFELAARNLGRIHGLNSACGLGAAEALDVVSGKLIDLRGSLVRACTGGRAAALSGQEDPYEAYRKLRKPLPKQHSGPMGPKKGKRGYDRKRNKQRTRREGI